MTYPPSAGKSADRSPFGVTPPGAGCASALRVGVKNPKDGGLDGSDDGRLRRQLTTAAAHDLDVFGVVEAKGWGTDDNRILHQAEHALGMRGYLVPSNHHGCHLVLFIRTGSGIAVVRDRRDVGPPWWHGLNDLEVMIEGFEGPVHLLLTHLAPSAAHLRLAEAQTFGLFRRTQAILMGDFNAAAADEHLPITDNDAAKAAAKRDRRPAWAIRDAGFIDVGGHCGQLQPTVGHGPAGGMAYRCDRIYTTLPGNLIRGYQVVIEDGEPDSDHRLVIAEIARPLAGGTS